MLITVVGVLSGVAEAGVLSLIAEISGDMVPRSRLVHVDLGLVSTDETMGRALLTACVLSVARLLLQGVGAWIPSRLSADVLAALRSRLFTVLSPRPRGTCSPTSGKGTCRN